VGGSYLQGARRGKRERKVRAWKSIAKEGRKLENNGKKTEAVVQDGGTKVSSHNGQKDLGAGGHWEF